MVCELVVAVDSTNDMPFDVQQAFAEHGEALFAIARNLVIDAMRARVRCLTPTDSEKLEWLSEPVTEDLRVVERIALYEGLATLTFEHRQVISAVQLHGVRFEELSEQTGVPVATLRTRMYYGLKALGAVLADRDTTEEWSARIAVLVSPTTSGESGLCGPVTLRRCSWGPQENDAWVGSAGSLTCSMSCSISTSGRARPI